MFTTSHKIIQLFTIIVLLFPVYVCLSFIFGLIIPNTVISYLFIYLLIILLILFSESKMLFVIYLVSSVVLIVASLITLIYQTRGRLFRDTFFIFLIVGTLAFVFVFGFKMQYWLAVQPKEGINYQVVWKPSGLDKIYRSILISGERKDNMFEVIGWLNDTTLVYKFRNLDKYKDDYNVEKLLQYNTVDDSSSEFMGSLSDVKITTCKYEECIVEFVIPEKSYDDRDARRRAFVSPDGRSVAYFARHVYGPGDIIIFHK